MYYCINVETGKEDYIMSLVKERCDKTLFQEVFTPKTEDIRRKDGKDFTIIKPLFPGYIFISTDKPKDFSVFLYNLPNFARMLGRVKEENEHNFVPLTDEDCLMIDTMCGKDVDRLLQTSFVSITEGKQVKVITGPLLGLEGKVSKVNLHKREVTIKLTLINKEVEAVFPINFVKQVY